MTEFEEFESMRIRGVGPVDAYKQAKNAGTNEIDSIRMLRVVYGQSFREAKETIILASGTAQSLEEHEASMARDIGELLKGK